MKKNNGITLIALILTIIILIILARVAINTLINNGIIDKAKTATQEYKNAQNYEETQIAKYTNDINEYIDSNRDNNFDFNWKFVGTGESINLPNEFNELSITCTSSLNGTEYNTKIHFTRLELSSDPKNYLFGSTSIYTVHHGISCQITASKTNISLIYVVHGGANDGYVSNGTLTVYYR